MGNTAAGQHDDLGVVVVGASAGGVEALKTLVGSLPHDLPYAVLVVLHMAASTPSVLARILERDATLPTAEASNGEALQPGTIRVAVPNRHLLVRGAHIALSEGPTENGHRPAINALFRSAAVSFGPRAVSVLLSGVLDDGTTGSAAIRSRGGVTIAQAPSDALFAAMPLSAIEAGVIDHQARAADIGALLTQVADRQDKECAMQPDPALELENRIAMARRFVIAGNAENLGPPSGYTCPDCNGSLMDVREGNYRCRVGHAWTAEALMSARDDEVENALWIAIRSLEEKSKLARNLAVEVNPGVVRERYDALADEAEHTTQVLSQRLSDADIRRRLDD